MRQVTINNVSFNVEPIVPSWPQFWDRAADGSWEPETFWTMDRYLTPEWRWVDIGAWIGPTVLYAAKKCSRVDAYECDPVALRALRANLALNPDIRNVEVNDFALGAADEHKMLWSSQLGNSESSLLTSGGLEGARVYILDAMKVFRTEGYASDEKTIVKMDVEGSELIILPRLAELIPQSKCVWLISLHPHLLEPAEILWLVKLFNSTQRVAFL